MHPNAATAGLIEMEVETDGVETEAVIEVEIEVATANVVMVNGAIVSDFVGSVMDFR